MSHGDFYIFLLSDNVKFQILDVETWVSCALGFCPFWVCRIHVLENRCAPGSLKLHTCRSHQKSRWIQSRAIGQRHRAPGASLPLLLVPSHATVATSSGRCLLRRNDAVASLVPMAVAGPGPFGVGVGAQMAHVELGTRTSQRNAIKS